MDKERLCKIKYLVIDVDGTMTDAGIYYDEHGNELKKFCTKDAAGYFAAKRAGITLMVLTGRECQATLRRMQEMKFDYIVQNIKDKATYLTDFMAANGLVKEDVGFIGDDLNDLPPMKLCGFVGCPADACDEVREYADYVSGINGGSGAVRDVIFAMLKVRGDWEQAVADVYGIGILLAKGLC